MQRGLAMAAQPSVTMMAGSDSDGPWFYMLIERHGMRELVRQMRLPNFTELRGLLISMRAAVEEAINQCDESERGPNKPLDPEFVYEFPPIDLRLDVGSDPAPFAMVHIDDVRDESLTLIVDFTQVEELEAFLEGGAA